MEHAQDLTALAFVLGVAVIAGLVMNRLRLPAIAGFILAGTVLGPTGFGLIGPSDAIATMAELGVLMLLFIIGMELRLQTFRKLLPLALGIAVAEIVVTTALMVSAAYFSSEQYKSAIVIGFMLAISSTAIAMKMMEDAGERTTPAGRLTLAVLIAQDLAVVPLLLITSAMGTGAEHHTPMFIVLRLLIALALLVGFIATLGRVKSFRFPYSEFFLRDPDVGTLAILGLCFVSAALSGVLGLSPALGAFLCGLAIGHSTLRPAALRTAPPVMSILLFTFFLSVGLLIDLNYVLRNFWLVVLALLVVALGKTLLNLAILRAFRQPGDVAFPAALFLAPIGEFSFVLVAAAASAGAITPGAQKLAMAVIALSLLVSPLWFIGARRAHKLALRGITEADALFRGSYRRELFVLRVWRRRATMVVVSASVYARDVYRHRRSKTSPMTGPAAGDPPPRPGPDE